MGNARFQSLIVAALLTLCAGAREPGPAKAAPTREAILSAARAMMVSQPYCAMATVAEGGEPSLRTMNPFPPEADFTVWFATNDRGRKAKELARNPRVTLYYANHQKAEGYVALSGKATLVTDPVEISKRKRAYWDTAFPGLKHLVLIKVVPQRVEVLSYKDGLNGETATWLAPSADFPAR